MVGACDPDFEDVGAILYLREISSLIKYEYQENTTIKYLRKERACHWRNE